MLTEAELEKVIMAVVCGQSAAGATEEEVRRAVDCPHRARVDGALLSAVLDGDAVIQVDPARGVRFSRAVDVARQLGTAPTDIGGVGQRRRAA